MKNEIRKVAEEVQTSKYVAIYNKFILYAHVVLKVEHYHKARKLR